MTNTPEQRDWLITSYDANLHAATTIAASGTHLDAVRAAERLIAAEGNQDYRILPA